MCTPGKRDVTPVYGMRPDEVMRPSRRSTLRLLALGAAAGAAGCAHHQHAATSPRGAGTDADVPPGWAEDHFPAQSGRKYFRRNGGGPPVVVLHEILGLNAGCFALGDRLFEKGFDVFLPLLFGDVGGHGILGGYFRSCGTRQYSCASKDKASAILPSLLAFCEQASRLANDKPIGVIGMCLTGAFPIWLLRSPVVAAPVLCQPTMPFSLFGPGEPTALGLSRDDLQPALRRQDVPLLGLRFTRDRRCPPQRFTALRELFGERFQTREIPSGVDPVPADAHSVLVGSYQNSGPTLAAFELTVDFLRKRLTTT
jgi:dienelactone hydrolase